MKSSSLINISSASIIKLIFSHLEYNHFFSLIKYNKEIQKNLNINFKENIFPNGYIEKEEKNYLYEDDEYETFSIAILYAAIYLYFFFHYLLNAFLTIKLNQKLYKNNNFFWESINDSTIRRALIPFIHLFTIFVLVHILNNFNRDYISTKKVFMILLDLLIFVYIYYELALFVKIRIIYSYALNGKWMIFFDVLLIIVNFFHILLTICSYCQYIKGKAYPEYKKIYLLNIYKGISIKEFLMSEDFNDYSIEDKNKFLLTNINNLRINYLENDLQLIKDINDFRLDQKLNELILDDKIPDFIVKGSTEIFLSSKNIIKLSNNKYVLRFNKNNIDFVTLKNDRDIAKILNNQFFNKINIIQQSNVKYIIIYEVLDEKNFNTILIRDNFGNEESILKTNVSN